MVHIPFRGGGEAVKELVAGQTQMELGSIGVFLSFIRSGQVRVLCVNDTKRTPVLPEVPTAKEAGLDNFVLPDWYALFGPKGIPPEAVERLDAAVKKILARLDMQKQMARGCRTDAGHEELGRACESSGGRNSLSGLRS